MAWKHFKLSEFDCNCCGGNMIDHELVALLDAGRERLAFPFRVRSGYRCPAHNDRVSSTGLNGPHTTGKAVDIGVLGREAFELLQWAMESRRFTGIGVSQKGMHERRFIHLDMLADPARFRPTIWSY